MYASGHDKYRPGGLSITFNFGEKDVGHPNPSPSFPPKEATTFGFVRAWPRPVRPPRVMIEARSPRERADERTGKYPYRVLGGVLFVSSARTQRRAERRARDDTSNNPTQPCKPPTMMASVSSTAVAAATICLALFADPSLAFTSSSPNPYNHAATRQQQSSGSLKMSSDASDLLYQEQEKLIVSRGELEEELMKGTASPLAANKVKVRGAGKAGGFGGGSSSLKISSAALKAEGKAHAKVLKRDGVVRIDNVLSSEQADKMREYVLSLREKSMEEVLAGKVTSIQRFANVLLRKDRCDLTMPLGKDDVIADSLNEVIRESAAAQTIKSILGKGAVLYELSCLISDPGSQRQNMHPDTPFLEGKGPVLYTCFIALQDIQLDMGPTDVATWYAYCRGTRSIPGWQLIRRKRKSKG